MSAFLFAEDATLVDKRYARRSGQSLTRLWIGIGVIVREGLTLSAKVAPLVRISAQSELERLC